MSARILIGSPIPAFAMDDRDWGHWLENAYAIDAHARERGFETEWLAVLQHDGRGRERFAPLLHELRLLNAVVQTGQRWFSIDPPDGDQKWTSENRLQSICTARNLIVDHALRHGHDWIYFADSDIAAPDDILVRLLELGWPVSGAHVPTYCLDGPRVHHVLGITPEDRRPLPAGADVRRHWNTAGSLLVRRDVFRRVPWRHDPDAGCTDDPATQAEMERLGFPTLVRHDVACTHHPQDIGPLEQRGLDLGAHR